MMMHVFFFIYPSQCHFCFPALIRMKSKLERLPMKIFICLPIHLTCFLGLSLFAIFEDHKHHLVLLVLPDPLPLSGTLAKRKCIPTSGQLNTNNNCILKILKVTAKHNLVHMKTYFVHFECILCTHCLPPKAAARLSWLSLVEQLAKLHSITLNIGLS